MQVVGKKKDLPQCHGKVSLPEKRVHSIRRNAINEIGWSVAIKELLGVHGDIPKSK